MNQKQQLENDIKELETKLNEMKATVAAMPPEAPARWVPEDQEQYFILDDLVTTANRRNLNPKLTEKHMSVGNVHRTKEGAETYRLRLESFVPALGPETPGDEALESGFVYGDQSQQIIPARMAVTESLRYAYQDGTWHPTKDAAEAWLAKYGKVRGYTV